MAKTPSRPAKLPRDHFAPFRNLGRKVRRAFQKLKSRRQAHRAAHPPRHRSFRRSYREDYQHPVKTPGLLHHAVTTFQIIFRHWRTFLPFIAIMVVLYILTVGLLSEDLYQQFNDAIDAGSDGLASGEVGNFARAALLLLSSVTTGGLSAGMSEVLVIFMVILFLIMWLVIIFLLRHFFAGEQPDMQVHPRLHRERLEELVEEPHIEILDHRRRTFDVEHQQRTAGEIQRDQRQRRDKRPNDDDATLPERGAREGLVLLVQHSPFLRAT